jgi:hypothetical protein
MHVFLFLAGKKSSMGLEGSRFTSNLYKSCWVDERVLSPVLCSIVSWSIVLLAMHICWANTMFAPEDIKILDPRG